jgi:acid phosphatase
MMRYVMRVALLVAALVAVAGSAGAAQPAVGPCGTLRTSAVHYRHVIWIVMENQSYSTIIGNSSARYINGLAKSCGLATNYHNVSHPSLPNYIAMTSGLGLSGIGQFTSDCDPSSTCSTSAPSIFGQTASWKAYEESMPSSCLRSGSGEYAVRHNPPPYFTKLAGCATSDVPYARLAGDLAHNRLPAFSFITPNLINDMHDGTVAQGDAWLKANVPTILTSGEFKAGTVVLFITWDEGEGGTSNDCATNTADVGCHVATLVVSPSTRPGTKSAKLFSHYSLLRSTELLLGRPLLGHARTAAGMLSAFGL